MEYIKSPTSPAEAAYEGEEDTTQAPTDPAKRLQPILQVGTDLRAVMNSSVVVLFCFQTHDM
jgi:hypothetical protein